MFLIQSISKAFNTVADTYNHLSHCITYISMYKLHAALCFTSIPIMYVCSSPMRACMNTKIRLFSAVAALILH